MNALILAAKAGAAPSIVEYRKTPATGAEQVCRTMDREVARRIRQASQGGEKYIDMVVDFAEVSGVADIIRKGGTITSKDYRPESR